MLRRVLFRSVPGPPLPRPPSPEAENGARAGGFTEARGLAMLELFYSTGIRLAELAGLNEQDVDLVSDQVKVRGKGKKERLLPGGGHAGRAPRRYYRPPEALGRVAARGGPAGFLGGRRRRLSP